MLVAWQLMSKTMLGCRRKDEVRNYKKHSCTKNMSTIGNDRACKASWTSAARLQAGQIRTLSQDAGINASFGMKSRVIGTRENIGSLQ
jgi:hypothetical protein